jgi:hypothetical protein
VRIEAVTKDAKGNDDRTGSVTSEFDATDFAPGCDPSSPPSFDLTKGDALAEPPPDKAKAPEKDEKPKPTTVQHKPAATQPKAPAPASPPPPAAATPAATPPPPAPPQEFNP